MSNSNIYLDYSRNIPGAVPAEEEPTHVFVRLYCLACSLNVSPRPRHQADLAGQVVFTSVHIGFSGPPADSSP